jgi:P-type Mg2+ transporter
VIRHHAGTEMHGDAGSPRQREIAIRQLVPGDLVMLSAGDMIPADCRVLAARDLFVAQAAMTGESAPVEKFAEWRDGAAGPLEQRNLVFMGTSVVSGSATVLVVSLRWLNAN